MRDLRNDMVTTSPSTNTSPPNNLPVFDKFARLKMPGVFHEFGMALIRSATLAFRRHSTTFFLDPTWVQLSVLTIGAS